MRTSEDFYLSSPGILSLTCQKKTFNENFYKLSVLSAYEQSNIDSYNIEEELQAKELNNYIDKIIEELPPKQQEIFILSRKENLSHKEIAELLNISERTVEVHIARAIRHIKSRRIPDRPPGSNGLT